MCGLATDFSSLEKIRLSLLERGVSWPQIRDSFRALLGMKITGKLGLLGSEKTFQNPLTLSANSRNFRAVVRP